MEDLRSHYRWNEFQTPYEDLHLERYPDEVQEQFHDFMATVPYLQWLASADRPRAKDLPRDERGRIIVDIAHPHILEDMDYFRPAVLHYQQTGRYCDYTPNANPNSPFMKWFIEETRRCWYGYVRESDGEWIPGDYYFFLNYCPMPLTDTETRKGRRAKRIIGFPRVWEGHYLKFHYLEQARNAGHHAAELASRGKGKSQCGAAMLAKRIIMGEDEDVKEKVISYITASDKKYLVANGDQTLDKFEYIINFIAQRTELQWPKQRITSTLQNMQWQMGYRDVSSGTKMGTQNSVIGVSSKDDEGKLRGSRGVLYVFEEFGCHIKGTEVLMQNCTYKKVEDVVVGDLLMGPDGTAREVQKCYSGTDQLYKITLSNGDWQIVNSAHPIRFIKHSWDKDIDTEMLCSAPELLDKNLQGCYIEKAQIKFPKRSVGIDPYFLGLWLGDGDSSRLDIANEDAEVLNWLSANYTGEVQDLKQSSTCKNFHISKKDSLDSEFKKYNLYGNKHIPDDYIYNSEEVQLQVIAGLIDTDGNCSRQKHGTVYEITQRYDRKHILDAIKCMATNCGFRCTMSTRISNGKKPGVLHYRLRISGELNKIPVKITRKKVERRVTKYKERRNWNYYTFKVEKYSIGEFYGFTCDKDHLFILKDWSIVHNTFPRLGELYSNVRFSVEEGDAVYGLLYSYGTSGDNQSDFQAAQEMVYNPSGYNIQPVENIYDKKGQGRNYFTYFFPGFINRDGCYNHDGVSDVSKALLEILRDRYTVKYNSTKLSTITKRVAEYPVTPQEAMLRTAKNMFPVAELNERLNQLYVDTHSQDDIYNGTLVMNNKGEVSFIPTTDTPIVDFPLPDNNAKGCLQIFSMPGKNSEGRVFPERYVIGLDPTDSDEAETLSLYSIFVLDLWTDQIAAEYTGRMDFADDMHELARKLALFYNCKILYENNIKGLYAYFSKMQCTHLLAETPEYLKDKNIIKLTGIGNKACGVTATQAVNNYANMLIRDWLIKPTPYITVDEEGNEIEKTASNLYKIRNIALIKELIAFNPEINVDRVRALGMAMLYREEKMVLYGGNPQSAKQEIESDYLGNDPFFTRNYDERMRKFSKKLH